MNGDPVLTQLPATDTLSVTVGIHQPFHPLQTIETPVFKSNGAHRGNRPHGNDGFSNTSQPWASNHRSHLNANQSRSYHNHNRNTNNRGVSNNNNSGGGVSYISNIGHKGNKGARMNNAHTQGHQYQMNSQYKRHDYSTQNNASGYVHNSYCQNLPSTAQIRRRHSEDSCAMLSNTHHGQPVPGIAQPETQPCSSALPLPRSMSYESGAQQTMNCSNQGQFHPRAANDVAYVHENYLLQHQFTHPSLDVSEQSCHSQARVVSNGTPSPPSEMAFQHQPVYAMTWGYLPQHIVPMLPQGMLMASQQSNLQGQEDMGLSCQSSPLQIAAPVMNAGAHDQGHGHDCLREQLEWYLSPRNLATDTYLVSKMNADRWVPISVIADFKKVKAITNDIQEVVNALRRSSKVQVDESGIMVKAITVDRPRTTLILRDLPVDSTQEVKGQTRPFYEHDRMMAESSPTNSDIEHIVGNRYNILRCRVHS